MVSKYGHAPVNQYLYQCEQLIACSLTPTNPLAFSPFACFSLDLHPPSAPQLHYSPLYLLHRSMSLFEPHILGLLYTTEKHQLH